MKTKWLPGVVIALLAPAPALAADAAVTKRYLDQPVFVFRAGMIMERRVPLQIRVGNTTWLDREVLTLGCAGKARSAGQLLAFLPRTAECLLFEPHSMAVIESRLGRRAAIGLKHDRAGLEQALETRELLRLDAVPLIPERVQACYCMPGGGELIFKDGFEDLL